MSKATLGSSAYFKQEVGEFLKLLGQKSFWEMENQPEGAIKALGHTYLETEDDPDESCAAIFQMAIDECTRRHVPVMMMNTEMEGCNDQN